MTPTTTITTHIYRAMTRHHYYHPSCAPASAVPCVAPTTTGTVCSACQQAIEPIPASVEMFTKVRISK